MRFLVLGGTGMVGRAALLAALAEPAVDEVVSVSRSSTGLTHPRLTEVLRPDLGDLSGVPELAGLDAVLDCLGVSSIGMDEAAYRAVTVDLGLAIADAVAEASGDGVRFLYVSGSGTDSSESGRVMWARVKGELENALLERFLHAAMFRPGIIWPRDGIRSRTGWVNALYAVTLPLRPVLRRVARGSVTDTREIGRAMVNVGLDRAPVPGSRVLETADIRRAAQA